MTDKKKAADEFENMFEKTLNQSSHVDMEENISTVEQMISPR